jgi:4-amino-4-deoxy-L-arabinose transferase-like glycosyltransferase
VLAALPAAFSRAGRRLREADPWPQFLAVWMAIPVAVFSMSQSKLPGYILPAIPAAALLAADYTMRAQQQAAEPLGKVLPWLHALAAALVLAFALASPTLLLLASGRMALLVAAAAGLIIFFGVALTLRLQGLRALRFVTLVPVLVGLAFLIHVAAPAIELSQSARPVARELARMEAQPLPVALFHVRRELEYGLAFYRNQAMHSYERGEVPPEDHLLVAGVGSLPELQLLLPARRFSRVGGFPSQQLDFLWVSTPATDHAGDHAPGHSH